MRALCIGNDQEGYIMNIAIRTAPPQPLALEDQTIDAYEDLEPRWVNVPFKRPMQLLWDWNSLLQNATARVKDVRLAIVGLAMGWSCELGHITVESLLQILGFEHIWSSNYLTSALQHSAVSEPAHTFAHKAIKKDGQVCHIVCAVFKGTTTVADTITDLESVSDGFLAAGTSCADALSTYVQGIEGATDANTILFITGHSLGGAIANVVGRLTKDIAEDDQRFVYTYASPNYECGDDGKSDYVFPNFRTFTNVADVVPKMPERFAKIGIEYTYDRETLDAKQRARFDESYQYFRGVAFEDDNDPIGLGVTQMSDPTAATALRNHLAATYMSFIASELTDEQVS